jgi:DNA-binding GntR family transcriptional regulator
VARGIIEGRLQPGDDLNSVELARRFSVSRTPVREALFVLHRERMVDWSPRRRPRVAAMFLQGRARDLSFTRDAVRAGVARDRRARDRRRHCVALARARRVLAEAAAQGDVDRYFWANVAFRDEELRVSRNAIFKEVLDSMRMRTNRMRHLSTSLPGRMQRSCTDHQRLCEAYAERDGTLPRR